MVPVEAGVGELDLVGEGPPDRDRLLRLVRDPVVSVLQPQAVPVHGRLDVAVVGHVHGDLRPLIDVQGRAGYRAVVGEHPQLGVVEPLTHRADADREAIAVLEPDDLGLCDVRDTGRVRGEGAPRTTGAVDLARHTGSVLHRSFPPPTGHDPRSNPSVATFPEWPRRNRGRARIEGRDRRYRLSRGELSIRGSFVRLMRDHPRRRTR